MNSTRYYKFAVALIFAVLVSGCMEEPAKVLQIGEKAPAFSLELLSGETSHLDRYAGKSVALTFMSSWCPCSNDSIPLMKNAYASNRDNDLVILMVGIQDSRSKFTQFVEKWQVPFPAGYDTGNTIAREYGVHAPPTTVFIDKNGNVKRVFYGNIADKREEFPHWIEEIL